MHKLIYSPKLKFVKILPLVGYGRTPMKVVRDMLVNNVEIDIRVGLASSSLKYSMCTIL